MDKPNKSLIIFKTDSGEVKLDQDTVWFNLNHLSQLFETDKFVISRHLKTSLRKKNQIKMQLLQNLQQLVHMEKRIRLNIMTWMLSFR